MMTKNFEEKDRFHGWAPDIETGPESWMRAEIDLDYGHQFLPYFKEALQSLCDVRTGTENIWAIAGKPLAARRNNR